jgi:aspartate/methionine/tyrosine aminotransferase
LPEAVDTVPLARRMATLPAYVFEDVARAVAAREAAGHPVVDLSISDPDVPPPAAVLAALRDAAAAPGAHRYPPYAGIGPLREAVAAWYRRRFDVTLDPDRQILITVGSKEALVHTALAFVNPGDAVLVPDPAYPAYAMAGALFGADTHRLPLTPGNDFLPDLTTVPDAVARRVRLWYLNFPSNPTGRIAPVDAWKGWLEWAHRRQCVVVSDLAYADIVYEGEAVSALTVGSPDAWVLESVTWSKSFDMQGWRVGALVGHPALVAAVRRVESNVNAGVWRPIQVAAATALATDPREDLRRRYRPRRDAAVAVLRRLGFAVRPPDGGVYCWIRRPGMDGDSLCRQALAAGVALTPGRAFGPASADYARVSLTQPAPQLVAGLERLSSLAGAR